MSTTQPDLAERIVATFMDLDVNDDAASAIRAVLRDAPEMAQVRDVILQYQSGCFPESHLNTAIIALDRLTGKDGAK